MPSQHKQSAPLCLHSTSSPLSCAFTAQAVRLVVPSQHNQSHQASQQQCHLLVHQVLLPVAASTQLTLQHDCHERPVGILELQWLTRGYSVCHPIPSLHPSSLSASGHSFFQQLFRWHTDLHACPQLGFIFINITNHEFASIITMSNHNNAESSVPPPH